MQAIRTAFMAPTNHRQAVIVASITHKGSPRVRLAYEHGWSPEENHRQACMMLRSILGWTLERGYMPMVSGSYKLDTYWVFLPKGTVLNGSPESIAALANN